MDASNGTSVDMSAGLIAVTYGVAGIEALVVKLLLNSAAKG